MSTETDSSLCFVLMPMEDEFVQLYEEVIKPTVMGLGLMCYYAGELFGARPVMQDVWDYCAKARVVIAELTRQNPNVYYEAGYAHAFDAEKVVFITQSMEEVTFDIRHFRCIEYSTLPRGLRDLRRKLSKNIEAVLAEEPRPARVTGVGESEGDGPGSICEAMELGRPSVILPQLLGSVELVLIPGGVFNMGGWQQDDVSVDSYYIGKYPTTNAQYKHFSDATAHQSPAHWSGRVLPAGKENHPVVHVSWHDSVAYCTWLAKETGCVSRLPTEAEWEKAAQGNRRRMYPWGDDLDQEKCNSMGSGIGDTTQVGNYSPGGDSPYGVCDMAGNVWEWTSSLFKPYPYRRDDGREAPDADGERVLRGGCFDSGDEEVACAYRHVHNDPVKRGKVMGFRVAATLGPADEG